MTTTPVAKSLLLTAGEIYVCEKRKAEKLMLLNFLNATENEFRGKKRCPFVATPQSILSKSMSFAYQKNSKLKPLFDPV